MNSLPKIYCQPTNFNDRLCSLMSATLNNPIIRPKFTRATLKKNHDRQRRRTVFMDTHKDSTDTLLKTNSNSNKRIVILVSFEGEGNDKRILQNLTDMIVQLSVSSIRCPVEIVMIQDEDWSQILDDSDKTSNTMTFVVILSFWRNSMSNTAAVSDIVNTFCEERRNNSSDSRNTLLGCIIIDEYNNNSSNKTTTTTTTTTIASQCLDNFLLEISNRNESYSFPMLVVSLSSSSSSSSMPIHTIQTPKERYYRLYPKLILVDLDLLDFLDNKPLPSLVMMMLITANIDFRLWLARTIVKYTEALLIIFKNERKVASTGMIIHSRL